MKQDRSKGKRHSSTTSNNDTQIDISLRAFINEQIDVLQTSLTVPPQEELVDCSSNDAAYKQVERAVKQIKWVLHTHTTYDHMYDYNELKPICFHHLLAAHPYKLKGRDVS